MKSFLMILCLAILTFAMIGVANSIVVFEDNFDAENGGSYLLNYDTFANWSVSDGSVDLIGLGSPWDWFPSYGLFIDMDGSTSDAGKMTSKPIALVPNSTYTLTYDLAGNQRMDQDDSVIVLVNGGSLVNNVHSIYWEKPFATFSVTFNSGTATNAIISFEGTGNDNIGMLLDNVKLEIVILAVEIDIKPGSYPNSINLGSKGVIPVAIFSSQDFDATTVDPGTVQLAGSGVAVRGNKFMSHEEDVNGDGLMDLVVQVETENLNPNTFQCGYAELTGTTYEGLSIVGWDEIRIVPK